MERRPEDGPQLKNVLKLEHRTKRENKNNNITKISTSVVILRSTRTKKEKRCV